MRLSNKDNSAAVQSEGDGTFSGMQSSSPPGSAGFFCGAIDLRQSPMPIALKTDSSGSGRSSCEKSAFRYG
ncbi:hypothetical protein AU512_15570 [Lonsdalea iberica]|uniref:Uncharacterized protein n=1 Tax=Lonsdalea iberica TaxID=1082703 RepID=A0ABX3XC92_9GAMM|nr:hypothetical protein [Lonsdalea iberica]OSN05760.1 hypothetical protein AU512_15570 [Lonsdalea iberica]